MSIFLVLLVDFVSQPSNTEFPEPQMEAFSVEEKSFIIKLGLLH